MGMLFGQKTPKTPEANTQVLNGVRVNSSTLGAVLPVIIGPARIPMNIIGLWDFLATAHTTPGSHVGKGLGGGGSTPSTTSYTYSTAMQAALGFGPIDHIDALWTSAGKIPVQALSTNFTIPGGGGHIDINDGGYQGDKGVGAHTAYSQLVDDFGADGSTTLSGTYDVPFTAGATPAPGVYTVTTPSAGVKRYTFHSSDGGKTVTINYTTNFAVVQLTAEIVIPGTASYDVPDPTNFQYPVQVNYAVSGDQFFGPGTITGVQQYNANLSGHYTFNSGDIGQTVIITYASKDPNSDAATVSNWSLIQGTDTQAAWSYLDAHHQDAALAHRNVAMIVSSALQLGSSGSMPQLSFEGIADKYMAGAGNAGCNPADVIAAILTDPDWGIEFDSALLGDWSNARDFWQAHGFFIALFQDTQSTAWEVIDQILDAGQAVRFWDDGKLQIAVYGDTSAAGNGAIFEPDTQPVFEFSVDDMVAAGGSEPVKVELKPENNVFNRVKVEFQNAQNDYNTDVIMEDDPASIQNFGINEEGQQSWHFIRSVQVAQLAANLRLKRMVNIREQFTMTVTTRYRADLKPMKLITVTWDKMGWNQKPLRVLSIEDTHAGLNLTLEEFPYGIGKPTIHPKMTPQAINTNPGLQNPGDSDIIALEEPDEMNGFIGRRVRIYANPETPDNWGGCEIFTSDNNTDFRQLGRITAPAVLGTLTSTLNVGTGDPDTQSLTMTVANGLQIVTPPTSDFDNKLSLLAIVDVAGTVEIVAFKNAALTGVSVYTVDTFHRALFGTTRASHVSGATIIELGESFVPFEYTPDRDGTHLYIKAASYNKFLGRQQDLGDISSVDIVLTGAYGGFFDKTTGTLIFDKITDTTNYKKTTPNQIQYLDSSSGRVIVSTILNDQGSVLPGQSVTFTKAAETTSTLGFSWGTQTIFRADGSSVTLSASSQSFSSLSSSTTYYFYPYLTFSGSTATMHFLGPYTSPSAVHALEAAFDTRTPMGALSDTTTSSGSGGGGDIDPGGPCPHEDEPVWIIRDGAEPVRMPAKDVRDGDYIKGWSFAEKKEKFRPVPQIRHAFSTMWYRVRGYLVSPCEPVYLDGQWIDAHSVPGAEKVRGVPAYRIEIKVGANEHEEHNYYLDNGTDAPLLIHNPILPRS